MAEINTLEAAQRALAEQKKRRTPEQEAHYERITERNKRIQERGVRPVDGVTFGSGKVPKP